MVTRLLAETGELRISAGKEVTRPKRKKHQFAALKPAPVAAFEAGRDFHSVTNEACSEQKNEKGLDQVMILMKSRIEKSSVKNVYKDKRIYEKNEKRYGIRNIVNTNTKHRIISETMLND